MDILRNLRILLWENNRFVLINENIRKGHSKGHEKATWSQDNTGDSRIGQQLVQEQKSLAFIHCSQ